MNFITEKLYFAKFKRIHHLTTGEIALWDALFMASNCVGLGKKFTISDKLLCADCSMSQNGIANARKGLIKAGLLTCSPYKRGELRTYRLKSMEQIMQSQFYSQNNDPYGDFVNHNGTDSGNDIVTDTVTETVTNINNKTRQKQKQYNSYKIRPTRFNNCGSSYPMSEDDILAMKIQNKRVKEMKEQNESCSS